MPVPGYRGPPITIGVLGCADIATRRVLPAIVAHPGLRLVAVASRSHEPVIRVDRPDGSRSIPLPTDNQCTNTVSAFVRAIRTGYAGGGGAIVGLARILEDICRLATVQRSV